mmetsp:Transcript_56958/g.133608  ORF Transcript_56958/g.133608 Transcript_56958/m.133608 type:complete len:205 (+) Transcript_56958:515-1129(+)
MSCTCLESPGGTTRTSGSAQSFAVMKKVAIAGPTIKTRNIKLNQVFLCCRLAGSSSKSLLARAYSSSKVASEFDLPSYWFSGSNDDRVQWQAPVFLARRPTSSEGPAGESSLRSASKASTSASRRLPGRTARCCPEPSRTATRPSGPPSSTVPTRPFNSTCRRPTKTTKLPQGGSSLSVSALKPSELLPSSEARPSISAATPHT